MALEIGIMDMHCTPPATMTSDVPLITAWAAKCTACCDEPHCRSMVVPTVVSGETGGQRGVAGDVDALLADLHDAAHDHVLDECRVDPVALDDRAQHLRRQIDRVLVLQLPVPAPEGGAKDVNDDGVGHCGLQGLVKFGQLEN